MSLHILVILAASLLSGAEDIRRAQTARELGTPYIVTGTVVRAFSDICPSWSIATPRGNLGIYSAPPGYAPPAAGSTVVASGYMRENGRPGDPSVTFCTNIVILSTGSAPIPLRINARRFTTEDFSQQLLTIRCRLQDFFHDEIDPNWYYLVLASDGVVFFATLPSPEDLTDDLRELIDAEVELTGTFSGISGGARRLTGHLLMLSSMNDIRVLNRANSLSYPLISNCIETDPSVIARLGRHRLQGTVIATWGVGHILVETSAGMISRLELADRYAIPPRGAKIEAIGFPETDLYRFNLSRATWETVGERCVGATSGNQTAPLKVSVSDIVVENAGRHQVQADYYGKTMTLVGTVTDSQDAISGQGVFTLRSDGISILIDVSTIETASVCPEAGSQVSVTGICILELDNWRPHATFPKITGMRLVPRTATDIITLRSAPWWTTGRLLLIIGTLLAALIGFIIWNRSLNRLVERRTRQLRHERSAKDDANLRTEERMRLAVELHDTLSQTLTGISLQIDSAEIAAESNPASVRGYLRTIRLRMMDCRKTLRDCLWDLRSRAFEERSLTEAIRTTLDPHLGSAKLVVDCQIARSELTDNTTHQLLCILRELAVNAVHHGHANCLHIAAENTKDGLLITITDDGSGFNPTDRPGPADGHFGLQGVSERIERLEGSLSIDSAPGRGTAITVKIPTDI